MNALVISLTALPVYLWGRKLVSRRWALVAAVDHARGALPRVRGTDHDRGRLLPNGRARGVGDGACRRRADGAPASARTRSDRARLRGADAGRRLPARICDGGRPRRRAAARPRTSARARCGAERPTARRAPVERLATAARRAADESPRRVPGRGRVRIRRGGGGALRPLPPRRPRADQRGRSVLRAGHRRVARRRGTRGQIQRARLRCDDALARRMDRRRSRRLRVAARRTPRGAEPVPARAAAPARARALAAARGAASSRPGAHRCARRRRVAHRRSRSSGSRRSPRRRLRSRRSRCTS